MLTKELSIAERVHPTFIEPMYAEAVRELPDGAIWTYETKLDGYRCLAARRSTGVVLWSRRGNGFTDRFLQIARACDKLPPDTLIDGEVIASMRAGVSRSTPYSTAMGRRIFSSMRSTFSFIADGT